MSNVTQKDINKISRLAKIELPQEGCDELSKQLNDIIGWVDKLNEIEAKDIHAKKLNLSMTLRRAIFYNILWMILNLS